MKEKCESTYNEVSRFAKFRELESKIKVLGLVLGGRDDCSVGTEFLFAVMTISKNIQ